MNTGNYWLDEHALDTHLESLLTENELWHKACEIASLVSVTIPDLTLTTGTRHLIFRAGEYGVKATYQDIADTDVETAADTIIRLMYAQIDCPEIA